MTLLILGGTCEARKLAETLGAEAILSLAGVTKGASRQNHRLRRGGFGGAAGLAEYLATEDIRAIIDATHPFSMEMSQSAILAADQQNVPLLRLMRPRWPKASEWQSAASLEVAAQLLPANARVFLSVGSRSLAAFWDRDDLWCLTRSIEMPKRLPARSEAILQRPPFKLDDELSLLRRHRITHLVSKNAGGAATRAKLEAAEALGVSVIMIERPQLPEVFTVETVAEAVKWVENLGD